MAAVDSSCCLKACPITCLKKELSCRLLTLQLVALDTCLYCRPSCLIVSTELRHRPAMAVIPTLKQLCVLDLVCAPTTGTYSQWASLARQTYWGQKVAVFAASMLIFGMCLQ